MARTSATSQQSIQEAKRDLTNFLKHLHTHPNLILEDESARLYAEAVAETPYETGKLEDAVYVRVSRDKRRPGLVAGASAKSPKGYDYSGIQHENTQFNHPIKGNAYYIANPFHRSIDRIKRRLDKEVRL